MSVCEYLFLQLKGNSFIHIEKSPENWCARRFFDCSVNLVLRLFIKPAFCESTFHFSLIVVKIILCSVFSLAICDEIDHGVPFVSVSMTVCIVF